MIFAVAPAFKIGTVSSAFIYGALFGFFCYMTFDLTNLAVLKLWSVKVAIVDIAWGSMITGVSAAIGFYAARTMSTI